MGIVVHPASIASSSTEAEAGAGAEAKVKPETETEVEVEETSSLVWPSDLSDALAVWAKHSRIDYRWQLLRVDFASQEEASRPCAKPGTAYCGATPPRVAEHLRAMAVLVEVEVEVEVEGEGEGKGEVEGEAEAGAGGEEDESELDEAAASHESRGARS